MVWPDNHKCAPQWEIKHEEYRGPDDFALVYAIDAEAAGEQYGEKRDNYGDYELANGGTYEVEIRKAGTATEEPGKWVAYILSGELTVNYCARPK